MSKVVKDPKNHAQKLVEVLQAAGSPEELEQLITDWFTPGERKDLWERWCIVDMLFRGNSQRDIRDQLKVSISKVTRGSRELQFGTGAFRRVWERIHKKQ